MRPRIAFVDTLAPRAYSLRPESHERLGGTEMTVVRVAAGLAAAAQVEVRQSARRSSERARGVTFVAFRPEMAADVFVVVNSWKVALKLRRLHPAARILVWLHVFPGRHQLSLGAALAAAGVEVVCVSGRHEAWLRAALPGPRPVITHIPNPVDDALAPDATPRDPDLLLFASSPHKGLDQVYARFASARAKIPTLRLAVADPGYLRWPVGPKPDGAFRVGCLSQTELHGWMRRALCLFCPQTRFAETFGLVIAEANALGCPALLHTGLGANDEVASTSAQCIDAASDDMIVETLSAWRRRPPSVVGRPEHRLSAVASAWRRRLAPERRMLDAPEARRAV